MGGITAQLRKKCVPFSSQCVERIWARVSDLSQGLSASEHTLFKRPARYTTASSRRLFLLASRGTGRYQVIRSAAAMLTVATWCSRRDLGHRRAPQSLSSANCQEQTIIASDCAEVSMRSCMMGRDPNSRS
jgi:hypothetical protein